MAQVYVKYNPYRLETMIKVNGKEIEHDSTMYKVVKGKRLQEWIGQFPQMLVNELNTVNFEMKFCGMDLDWDDFEDAFKSELEKGNIKKLGLEFIEGKTDEQINEKIVDIFTDLQDGPIEDFRDKRLIRAFENINEAEFPINVIATMSSGKSTLINALLCKKLMPSKNEACTAVITEILDNDNENFTAVVYNSELDIIEKVPELTYEIMDKLNGNEEVYKIAAVGEIPFLDAKTTALKLIDTPGPNNSQNDAHQKTTYRAVNDDSNNLILYVLNGTQLSTNDDAELLRYVSEQIKKGGKQARDRFLFVINKMDGFDPEEEDIAKAVNAAKNYLSQYGIEDPQIFPCSAYAALNIRTYLRDIDIDNLKRNEQRALPSAARDTLPMIDKFIDYESMHLEKYSTLSPSAKRELDYKLKMAEERNDTKEMALIHSGIYSIEAAIRAYVKKYAKTKKIKDLVESFREVLESNQVLSKAKTQVATDEEAAKECSQRAAIINEKIANGKEAKAFKAKIDKLNPINYIKTKAKALEDDGIRQAAKIFEHYGTTELHSREEVQRLVHQFTETGSDAITKLSVEIESLINKEIKETGENLLTEYCKKLEAFDAESSNKCLDFSSEDLISGALSNMKNDISKWLSNDELADKTAEDYGTVEVEEREYYEKVGEKEEKVADGTEKVKVGTERVKTGSHKEWVGTREVRNPAKRWWKIFTPSYIEEDVYETVDDYEDKDVYETVIKYKTIMRDVFDKKVERTEKYTANLADIQAGIVVNLRKNAHAGVTEAVKYANQQIKDMKEQFKNMFDELDKQISQKYKELEKCANDQKIKEETLAYNKKILSWIEGNIKEIDDILEI